MLMFASMSTPTTQVIIAWPSATAVDPELLSVDISIEVADVDAAYETAGAEGLEIVRELRDEPWGIRRFLSATPLDARSTSPATCSSPGPLRVSLIDRPVGLASHSRDAALPRCG